MFKCLFKSKPKKLTITQTSYKKVLGVPVKTNTVEYSFTSEAKIKDCWSHVSKRG